MPKVLFISTIAGTAIFNRPFMRWFKEQGWQVDYASTGEKDVMDCDNQYAIAMTRNPFSIKNIQAIKSLKKLLEKENYHIVHCHTPVASAITRIAAKKFRKKGLKVLYTAHGFHFYTDAPLLNWLIYYPMEKYLAKFTDGIITINNEDFLRAQKKFRKSGTIYKIDGVGTDLNHFHSVTENEKEQLRNQYGYNSNDFIVLYIAECIPRKNHAYLLHEIPVLRQAIPNLKVLFAGQGKLIEHAKNIAKSMAITETVDFLGYRTDIEKLCQIADIHVSPSKQEGLAVNNLEAMASGLPVVCSKIRGHTDVIIDGQNGFLFALDEPAVMVHAIIELYKDQSLRQRMAKQNIVDVKKFSVDISVLKKADIYERFVGGRGRGRGGRGAGV
jgi:glycosyltransferase EpsD